ncbi:coiled-coil domain-containing protein 7 isoform X3 [Phascolarctos cinereus]|uniref:Coiled-coil domain-containing protein 7 isoform X2 n=1 Tax=Phascolarctos cinereus TaxID=38626 RepID=A0A6P5KMB6_PHACI|nr:coiled-coil domain-containing protein 7 isoform X2 [Phascolarctos cinereus]
MKSSKAKIAPFSLGVENPGLASKKVSTISAALSKARKKSNTKFNNESELMFLAPPPVGESMLKYAIAIPSENAQNALGDEQIVRQVANHLKEISSSLEKAYGFDTEKDRLAERVPRPEGEESTPTEAEDMTSFLLSCTSLAKQLEEAVKEEQQILESVFKWFQKEVYHVEELVKEQNVPDWELPLPDKAVSSSIFQVIERLQKLEQLRNRLSTVPTATRRAVAAKHKLDSQSETAQIYEDVKKMIEDFGANFQNDEFVENIMNIADIVFLPESTELKDLQFQEMFKIFEKQAIKLHRMMNELDNLELQLLQREKILLELQKKKLEKKASRDSRLGDLERISTDFSMASSGSLSQSLEGQNASALLDVPSKSSKEQMQKGKKPEVYGQSSSKRSLILTSSDAVKLKEELLQAQKVVISLESENKFLQEQLKDALQEVEKAKKDLEASHAEIEKGSRNDNESIASEKSKKGKKGKGESKKDKKAKTTKSSQAANIKTAGRS